MRGPPAFLIPSSRPAPVSRVDGRLAWTLWTREPPRPYRTSCFRWVAYEDDSHWRMLVASPVNAHRYHASAPLQVVIGRTGRPLGESLLSRSYLDCCRTDPATDDEREGWKLPLFRALTGDAAPSGAAIPYSRLGGLLLRLRQADDREELAAALAFFGARSVFEDHAQVSNTLSVE